MLVNRRQFLITSLGTVALGVVPPKPQSRIGIGVIGLGRQGRQLVQELLWLRKTYPVEIIGLCDTQSQALGAAAQLIPQAHQTDDYREVLTWEGVQAVIIATPDSSHAAIAQAVLEAGFDLYLEPPLARKLAEAEQLIRLAEAQGNVVQLGIHQVVHPGYAIAREIIAAGGLGKVSRIEIAIASEGLPPSAAWQLSSESSDGLAILSLLHAFEVVRYVMDVSLPSQIAAQGGIYIQQDGRTNPDTFHVLLNYPQGFLVSFSFGLGEEVFNIYGTQGRLDLLNWQLIPTGGIPTALPVGTADQPENTLRSHLVDWLTSTQSRGKPRLPIQAGYEQVKLAEAVLAAYHNHESHV
jgi:predicted dehydrogenase